jgi:signal transduction histidine kinase
MVDNYSLVDESKRGEVMALIKDSSQSGLNIVEVVRKIRALDEKKHAFKLCKVDLKDVIDASCRMLSNRFEDKAIELIVDCPAHSYVMAEPISLSNTVLNNLLTNALKFSWTGTKVELSVKKAGSKYLLSVKDQGMGMSEDMLEHLFEVAMTNSRLGTDNEQGTGFGMALVKRFVEHYGGDISVSSNMETENSGTTVMISFDVLVERSK